MGVDAMMEVRFDRDVSDDEIRRWSYDLGIAFGVGRNGPFLFSPHDGQQILVRNTEYEYRNEDEAGDPRRLKVRLFGLYYGPGYERGNCWQLIGIADFLERRTGGSVWYGGDSGDVAPFGREEREALAAHFASDDGRNYFKPHGRFDPPGPDCPHCMMPTRFCMWGPDGRGSVCGGCGWKALVARDERDNTVLASGWGAPTNDFIQPWPGQKDWKPATSFKVSR